MIEAVEDPEFQGRMRRLEDLLREIDGIADASVRAKMAQIVQSIMEFHGEAISRILTRLDGAGEAGRTVISDFIKDDLISSVFLLYGLHPQDLQTRVQAALDTSRPYLASHGGNVELLGITDEGVVRLHLQGSCHGCPSSAVTMKLNIEKAIYEKAPDVAAIVVEGDSEEPEFAGQTSAKAIPGFVPVDNLIASGLKISTRQGATL